MLELPSSTGTAVGFPPFAFAVRRGTPCWAVTPFLPRGAPVSAVRRSQYFLYSVASLGDRAIMELLVCAQRAREVQFVEPNWTVFGKSLLNRSVNLLCPKWPLSIKRSPTPTPACLICSRWAEYVSFVLALVFPTLPGIFERMMW